MHFIWRLHSIKKSRLESGLTKTKKLQGAVHFSVVYPKSSFKINGSSNQAKVSQKSPFLTLYVRKIYPNLDRKHNFKTGNKCQAITIGIGTCIKAKLGPTLRLLLQNPDKELNRRELLTQPMRVQVVGLPHTATILLSE